MTIYSKLYFLGYDILINILIGVAPSSDTFRMDNQTRIWNFIWQGYCARITEAAGFRSAFSSVQTKCETEDVFGSMPTFFQVPWNEP